MRHLHLDSLCRAVEHVSEELVQVGLVLAVLCQHRVQQVAAMEVLQTPLDSAVLEIDVAVRANNEILVSVGSHRVQSLAFILEPVTASHRLHDALQLLVHIVVLELGDGH